MLAQVGFKNGVYLDRLTNKSCNLSNIYNIKKIIKFKPIFKLQVKLKKAVTCELLHFYKLCVFFF